MNRSKGFTLIELLVVIAIIGLLSSVILTSLNSARVKGRDARRLSDIKQLQVALELYYSDHIAAGSFTGYPDTAGGLAALATAYIASVPKDPKNNSDYSYSSTSGSSTYVLSAAMEGTPPTSSATCPSGFNYCVRP